METVLTCVGENTWGIAQSDFSSIQGMQIHVIYKIYVLSRAPEEIASPKPTEEVDTTLRLGPAVKRQCRFVAINLKPNPEFTSLEELFVNLK
jgi:hypothetical protein